MSYARIHIQTYNPDGTIAGPVDVETSWYHTNLVFVRPGNGPGFYVAAADLLAAIQEVQRQAVPPIQPLPRDVPGV